ncbi:MAG: oxidoreductase [Parcubacteria group bacterium]|nr:oxidoreductase [Parcubacteria group bacterium]
MDEKNVVLEDLKHAEEERNKWFIPAAIIAAGLLLAISVYIERTHHILGSVPKGDITAVRPVTSEDHIIGSPSAPVKIIEYGDIDSSYGKSFQKVMEQLMVTYAPGGKVAWIYRHFPIIDQYPNSESHAEAAECASSLGKADSFWNFIDLVQAYAPGDQQFDPSGYDNVVSALGIDTTRFDSCMTAHTYLKRVNDDISNAIAIGASGSPYTVILIHGQKPLSLSGSLPYDAMKKIVDQSIAKAK